MPDAPTLPALPRTLASAHEVQQYVRAGQLAGKRVGLVPTMGALHAGHLSLVERCRRECDIVIVSIFVNPKQFGPKEDFKKYPRTLEADLALLAPLAVELVFTPTTEEIFPPGFSTSVDVRGLTRQWEGAARPGHFRGVATVVLKLLQIVPADRAYFGRKDYQQLLTIERMVTDLNLPIQIVPCPLVREPDGLAMSSRNANPQRRRAAACAGAFAQLAAGARNVRRQRARCGQNSRCRARCDGRRARRANRIRRRGGSKQLEGTSSHRFLCRSAAGRPRGQNPPHRQ